MGRKCSFRAVLGHVTEKKGMLKFYCFIVKCPELDLVYYGHDIGGGRVRNIGTWKLCAKECQKRSDCHAWSWRGDIQYCYLKNQNYLRGRKRDFEYVSGLKSCGGER